MTVYRLHYLVLSYQSSHTIQTDVQLQFLCLCRLHYFVLYSHRSNNKQTNVQFQYFCLCRLQFLVLSSELPHNKHSKFQLHFLCLCSDYSTLYYPPTFLTKNIVTFSCSSYVCVPITEPGTILPPSSLQTQ
jgi:hypothetical protein